MDRNINSGAHSCILKIKDPKKTKLVEYVRITSTLKKKSFLQNVSADRKHKHVGVSLRLVQFWLGEVTIRK